MATATVKSFNCASGYGFLRPDEGGPDVFVHLSALVGKARGYEFLVAGDRVSYELAPSSALRKRAKQVRLVGDIGERLTITGD